MRTLLLVATASLILTPVSAQEWTAEQEEVWEFEQACWATQELEVIMSCFHDDFLGWGLDNTLPTTKADRRPFFARSLETAEQVFLSLQRVAINVRGNTATVLYLATFTDRNRETDVETTRIERWTDIAVREGGRWSWIADHGVLISEN